MVMLQRATLDRYKTSDRFEHDSVLAGGRDCKWKVVS